MGGGGGGGWNGEIVEMETGNGNHGAMFAIDKPEGHSKKSCLNS